MCIEYRPCTHGNIWGLRITGLKEIVRVTANTVLQKFNQCFLYDAIPAAVEVLGVVDDADLVGRHAADAVLADVLPCRWLRSRAGTARRENGPS